MIKDAKLKKALKKENLNIDFTILDNQSTNEYARENIHCKDFLIVAKQQYNGQGRKQRQFVSREGGAYFSLKLWQETQNFSPNKYVIVAGLAVVKMLQSFNIASCLKWPNDVYVEGKKIAGILCKSLFDKQKICVIMGIGINVENDISDISDIAVKMADYKKDNEIEDIIAKVCANIYQILSLDNELIIKEYKENSMILGKQILVQKENESYKAIAKDISPEGYLIIEVGDKKEVLTIGDVSIRKI